MDCEFKQRREHDVMDEDWSVSLVTNRLRDKAWSQPGLGLPLTGALGPGPTAWGR